MASRRAAAPLKSLFPLDLEITYTVNLERGKVLYTPYNKLIIKIDIDMHFISLETANHKLITSGEYWMDKDKKDMFISDFRTVKEYRNKGYGTFLARVFIDLARLYRCKAVNLTDGSTLEGFWQRLGFEKDDKTNCLVLEL